MPTEIITMLLRITIGLLGLAIFITIFLNLLRSYKSRFFQKEKLTKDEAELIDKYLSNEEEVKQYPLTLNESLNLKNIKGFESTGKRMPPKPSDPLVSIILPQTLPGPGKTYATGVDPYKKEEDDDSLTPSELKLMNDYIEAMKDRGYETL